MNFSIQIDEKFIEVRIWKRPADMYVVTYYKRWNRPSVKRVINWWKSRAWVRVAKRVRDENKETTHTSCRHEHRS